MIVVVARRKAGVDCLRLAGREIEAVEPSFLRINERLPIVSPIRRLKGSTVLMYDRRVPGRDVEKLEVAAEIVAIRDEIALRGHRDANVAEGRALDDLLHRRSEDDRGPS